MLIVMVAAPSASALRLKVSRRYTRRVASDRRSLSVSDQAADNLSFIRSAIERSSTFSAVPGVGGVVTGIIGLLAAITAAPQPTPERWLGVWLAAASVAVIVEVVSMTSKARRAEMTLTGTNARRFFVALAAPLVAGAAITYQLWKLRSFAVMTPVWLLLYGAGVLTGGMFSTPAVRTLGVCFMAAGIVAIATPSEWDNIWLALGFGGLHVGFGAYIARNHGG
jgi:hypothetical protein